MELIRGPEIDPIWTRHMKCQFCKRVCKVNEDDIRVKKESYYYGGYRRKYFFHCYCGQVIQIHDTHTMTAQQEVRIFQNYHQMWFMKKFLFNIRKVINNFISKKHKLPPDLYNLLEGTDKKLLK